MKRICIIGGGASGITAAKACIEEGLDYVVYEMYHTFGGLWRYRDEDVNGLASVAAATIINSSKEMSAFSDFPPRDEYPNYMHNSRMIQYIEDYAKRVGCIDKMKFQHKVLSVKKSAHFQEDGSWDVEVEDQANGNRRTTETFAGVMVCTGHHVTPSMAHFPGQDKFRGQILHTHSYKRPRDFVGKRVVVVGIGNSGGDVAVELSMVNDKVHLSTRRGAWVVHRVGPMGKPFDTLFLRRSINCLFNTMPYKFVCATSENFINYHFDHSNYKIKPKHRIFEQHIMVNDALPNRILSGTIELKNNIQSITETGVIFQGETEEVPCDVIIMATGYKVDFPFIDQSLVPVMDNKVDLYKYVYAPDLQPHPHTLGFIALAQPIGALFPIAEMHSRWYALVMNGKRQLPSAEKMHKDIQRKHKYLESRYYGGPRNTLQVDWINYMDELAELVGCKPSVSKYFFKDFKLWWSLVFGPCYPYQYRLEGPHSWESARDTILEAPLRIKAPLLTRELTDKQGEFLHNPAAGQKARQNGYKKID